MKGEGGGGECSAQNSHPVKLFFKAESERKPSPDEGEHTCTTRNTFQIVRQVELTHMIPDRNVKLQDEMKSTGNWKCTGVYFLKK